jgi:hypothetical protein
MKMYVTKYALTKGVILIPVREHGLSEDYVLDGRTRDYNSIRVNRDAFTDPVAALVDAEKRRAKKIRQLREQIAKLEALTFTVPTEEARL